MMKQIKNNKQNQSKEINELCCTKNENGKIVDNENERIMYESL